MNVHSCGRQRVVDVSSAFREACIRIPVPPLHTVSVIWGILLFLFFLLNIPTYEIGIIISWMSRRLNELNRC